MHYIKLILIDSLTNTRKSKDQSSTDPVELEATAKPAKHVAVSRCNPGRIEPSLKGCWCIWCSLSAHSSFHVHWSAHAVHWQCKTTGGFLGELDNKSLQGNKRNMSKVNIMHMPLIAFTAFTAFIAWCSLFLHGHSKIMIYAIQRTKDGNALVSSVPCWIRIDLPDGAPTIDWGKSWFQEGRLDT